MKTMLRAWLESACGLVLGFALGALVVWLAGENPLTIGKILFHSAFGSRYDFGLTLFYATPLIFTGLSVAFAFQAGLFNIGAEGQLNLAALAAAIVGAVWQELPAPWAPLLAGAAALLVGALWGLIPGVLKAFRGSHEVINTIMLNFISAALCSWIALTYFQNPNSQNPETRDMGPAYVIHAHDPLAHYFADTPVSSVFLLAVLAAFGIWFLLHRTRFGYRLRATGQSEEAARYAGIDPKRAKVWALTIAGALAAGAAWGEVIGHAGRYRLGFSADYGFIGIAVALLARNHPLAVIFTAILFAALHKGAASLDLETEYVTRDLSVVLQALIILSVSATGLWSFLKKRKEKP